jgi:hypothetical protein
MSTGFNLTRLGLDNGYLADSAQAGVIEARLEPDAMVVVSSERRDFHWDIYMVRRPRENKTDNFPYPLMDNRR